MAGAERACGARVNAPERTVGGRIAGRGYSTPLPIFAWLFVLRPWLAANDQGVTLRNPLSVRRLAYHDIIAVRPGYWAITMQTQNGVVIATAVRKANASVWLHRQDHADQVAKLIQDRATVGVGERHSGRLVLARPRSFCSPRRSDVRPR